MFDFFLKGLKGGFYIVFSVILLFGTVGFAILPIWLAITYSYWWFLLYIIVIPFIFGVANIVFSF